MAVKKFFEASSPVEQTGLQIREGHDLNPSAGKKIPTGVRDANMNTDSPRRWTWWTTRTDMCPHRNKWTKSTFF
jgi:hypothetical protein